MRWRWLPLLVVAALALAACGVEKTDSTVPPPVPVSSKAVAEIVKRLRPSVVHIQTESVRLDQFSLPSPNVGVGTGEILDEQGNILTNNHVVEGAQRIIVTLSDGRSFEAALVGTDSFTDLAVVRIKAQGLTPIPLGQSSTLEVGDDVIAIGQALDLEGGPTVTKGVVGALERSIAVDASTTIQHLIQTDAAINPGNSGGPLVDLMGRMVGVNSAGVPSAEGIGFAIAIDAAKPVIEELIANGRVQRGYVGITPTNITRGLALNFNLPVTSGVGVVEVAAGSPADRAGLRAGDIIVKLAGEEVPNVAALADILTRHRAGNSVGVELFRGNARRSVTVVLGARPD